MTHICDQNTDPTTLLKAITWTYAMYALRPNSKTRKHESHQAMFKLIYTLSFNCFFTKTEKLGTCEASRFDSNSNRPLWFDSTVMGLFENFWNRPCLPIARSSHYTTQIISLTLKMAQSNLTDWKCTYNGKMQSFPSCRHQTAAIKISLLWTDNRSKRGEKLQNVAHALCIT